MDIGSKAKVLFNEISFGLLNLIGPIHKDKIYHINNTMKPIPSAKPFLGIGGKRRLPIDMSNYAYHPGYVSSSDDEPKNYINF